MNAQIPGLTVAELDRVAPAAGMDLGVVGNEWRRAAIHLPIERRRRWCRRRIGLARAVVAVDVDRGNFSQAAGGDEAVAGLEKMRGAAALKADLDGAAMEPRRRHHRPPLDNIEADRLLHIDIGPRFAGGDHRQAVPVVGRADEDDLRRGIGEERAVVAKQRRRVAGGLPLGDKGRGGLAHRRIDITQPDDLHRRHLHEMEEVGLPIPTATDEPHAEWLEGLGGSGRLGP